MRYIVMALALIMLGGCGGVSQKAGRDYLAERRIPLSTPETVQHCHGYGCQIVTPVELSKKDWKIIKKTYGGKAKNAESERKKITKTIGVFEQIVGARAGTDKDVMGTFRETGNDQLDCVDESTNTTIYLTLLEGEGLLKFHEVLSPAVRLPLVHSGNWPHQSAVLREVKTGEYYAVDSWFRDNGAAADIIDLKSWRAGWRPDDVRDISL